MTIWEGKRVAFIGGDRRESEMALIAKGLGAEPRVFGAPEIPGGIPASPSLQDALEGADVAVLPVPLNAPDGSLYAPFADTPIHPDAAALKTMTEAAHVVTGKADELLRAAASEAGVSLHEYEHDTDLMLMRAPAIAEGAIRVAIERSPVTIHGTEIGILGFGRVAATLARSLLALQGRVHVFARRAEARAAAHALGSTPHSFDEINDVFPSLPILYNSVPARVLGEDELRHLPAGALVVDMAAPPGGVDPDAAARLGLDPFWARGLGASAPKTVAASQWIGVDRIVRAALSGSES
jgi:dipicolinate synthase subunit A